MHILLPNFLFPPFCGPGSMRLGRFVRYWAEFGSHVTVVTTSPEDYRADFPRHQNLDWKLNENFPCRINIIRTKPVHHLWNSKSPQLSQPDKTIVWNSIAAEKCKLIHTKNPVDILFTSSNPLSTHLLGLLLKSQLGIPWIAEFRDPWTTSPFRVWNDKRQHLFEREQHEKILRNADHVIVNTPVAKTETIKAFPFLGSQKVTVVTNFFHSKSMSSIAKNFCRHKSNRLTIAHVGTLRKIDIPHGSARFRLVLKAFLRMINRGNGYKLCRTNKYGNSLAYFSKALHLLVNEDPDWKFRLRLELAGRVGVTDAKKEIQNLMNRYDINGMVRYNGLVSHQDALGILYNADVLLINQEYPLNGKECSVVPAKLYEYFGSKKPILGLLPPGDAKNFLIDSGIGHVSDPASPKKISNLIKHIYKIHANVGLKTSPHRSFTRQFDSSVLSKIVWDEFKSILKSKT